MNNKYGEKLVHLTDDEVDKLISRYYQGEKIDALIKEYSIDISSSLLSKTFPVKIHEDILCPYCKTPLFSYRKSRTADSSAIQEQYCQTCKHHAIYDCNCTKCKEIKKSKHEEKVKLEGINLVKQFCDIEPTPYQNLFLEQGILLLTLFCSNNNLKTINYYCRKNIFPHEKITEEHILHLITENIIKVKKSSILEINKRINNTPSAKYLEESEKLNLILCNTELELNISRDGKNTINNQELVSLLRSDISSSNINYDDSEVFKYFIKLSMYEALSYLYKDGFISKLKEHQTKNIHESIQAILKKYTLSQAKGIVNLCYKKYNKINSPFKKNIFIKNIREYNGNMKNYDRLSYLPMCLVSEVFCNVLLQTSEDYYRYNIYDFFKRKYKSIA